MKNTTLLIMAAGMGSRFGNLKQISPLGPYKKAILHYTIYDAVEAGFDKIVFVIRESFAEEFKDFVGKYAESRCRVEYCFQTMEELPGNMPSVDREKPWGTAHAIWCAHKLINEPFAVVNADDFYGRDAFVKARDFLSGLNGKNEYCLIGYNLDATLSDFGSVSRGICRTDPDNYLVSVTEHTKIEKNGDIIKDRTTGSIINGNATVSMNFWGFTPCIFKEIEKDFIDFYPTAKDNPKSEFYIPQVVDKLLREGCAKVKVIPTSSRWFGITYKEDTPLVNTKLETLHTQGLYKNLE